MKYLNLSKKDSLLYVTIELILLSVLLTGFNFYGKSQNLAVQAGLCRLRDSQFSGFSCDRIPERRTGFGIGVKIFTIAGPVILYGIFSSLLLD